MIVLEMEMHCNGVEELERKMTMEGDKTPAASLLRYGRKSLAKYFEYYLKRFWIRILNLDWICHYK